MRIYKKILVSCSIMITGIGLPVYYHTWKYNNKKDLQQVKIGY